MKIALLSRGPDLYSTRRIREACEKRGHEVDVLNALSFTILVEESRPRLLYRNEPLGSYDAVIPRIGASITFFGCAVVRQFEQMGVFCLNSSQPILNSRDKLRSIQLLSRHNLGLASTAFVKRNTGILPAIEKIGGAPVVIKLLEGTQGIGVILADDTKVAEAIVETLQATRQNVLLQKFVPESKGRDLRAFVVGGRVVAAMRRSASGGDFRSNVHRGGTVEGVDLSPEFERTAIHATHVMGLEVAGVDMLEATDGPKILEVNSSPGLEGIERATKVDVAGAIAGHLEQEVLFPEIDIEERLALASGYGVAEVPIAEGSDLAHVTIADSGLRARDMLVLSIGRGSVTIPNPKGSREILPGDRLLCFGLLQEIRTLTPRASGGSDGSG